MSRRTVVNAALAGAVGLTLPRLVQTSLAATRQPSLATTRLNGGLLLLQGAGGNVVALGSDAGVLLVDGGSPEHSKALLKRVSDEFANKPVKTLFNTHWHWDHTGSNETLAGSGASIIAHENTKLWLSTPVVSTWERRTYPARPAAALPNQTFFYDSKQMSFGGQSVEYGHLPQAHTDGDIYVFFPTQNVLAGGDVVAGGTYPVLDYCTTGWIGGMIEGLKDLIAKCDATTQVIPGAGPVRAKADLEAQLEMCYTVITRIGESYYKGQTWDEFLASKPTREFDATWGTPDLFLRTAYEGAWHHVNEIRRIRR